MASSGSFTTSSYKNLSMMVSWSVKSQSIEKNTTTISWSLKGYRTDGATGFITCGGFKVVINDVTVYSQSNDYRVNVYNGTVVASGTLDISHDSEGNKSFTASAEAAIYYWAVNCSGSGSFSLPQIPRVSVPTLSASSVNFGSKITIYTNRKSSSFTHHLYYSVNGGDEVGITPNIGSSYTWTVPYDLMSNIPNAKSATIMFRLYTFSGETNIGNNTINFTATVPDNSTTRPSLTIDSLIPVSNLSSPFDTLFIQGKSKVQANFTCAGKYGASIKTCTMSVDGKSYGSSNDYTSAYLSSYGEKTVTITTTDSRGISNSISQNITVIAYSDPKIQDVVAVRCDVDGNQTTSGTYLKIIAKRNYSKVVSDGVQKNFCKIRYRYKIASASSYSSWVVILAGDALDSDEIVTGALLGALSNASSYLVQVQAIDDVGKYGLTTISIPTERVYWHRDGARNSLTFGGYVEEDNTFAIADGIEFKVKSEKWVSLGLSANVAESEYTFGRADGKGCHYRVVNGNHVFVAFNCAFTYSGSSITLNANTLPAGLRPPRNVYALCPIAGRAVARVIVNASGNVLIDWVQSLTTGVTTSSLDVSWIDGYIDFFV